MELSSYLQILNRRIWIVVITTLAAVVAFYFLQARTPTSYEATTVLRITPYSTTNPTFTTLAYAERIMNTYVEIATSSPVLDELRGRLGLTGGQPNDIEAVVIPDTELLRITAVDSNPILARDSANTLADMLLDVQVVRGINVSIIEPASTPKPPSITRTIMIGVLIVIVGFLGGAGLAFLFENLDTRLHTTEQIVSLTGLPLLGEIPSAKKRQNVGWLVDLMPYADVFRRTRVNILTLSENTPLNSLLITSAEPDEGKSTIVANLARSMAQTGRTIAVLDTDLHCATIHTIFELPNEIGLSSVLEGKVKLSAALQESEFPGIHVLTSGPQFPAPAEALGSEEMREVLRQLLKQFDIVLLDTPAFLGVADAAMLAPHVDGVMLIVRRGSIREASLRTTCQQLLNVNANLIGVIVNRVNVNLSSRYGKYYQQDKAYQVTDEALDKQS
jgi:receptor protein-tyrosine kinase